MLSRTSEPEEDVAQNCNSYPSVICRDKIKKYMMICTCNTHERLEGNCKGCYNFEDVHYTYEEIPKKQRFITGVLISP